MRARGVATASAIALSLCLACGSASPGVGPRESTEHQGDQPLRVGSVVASDTECEFTGDLTVTSGEIVIEIENRSPWLLNVFLRQIFEGHTYAEFVTWVDRQNAGMSADLLPGPPLWVMSATEEWWVPAGGGRAEMDGWVDPGTYAIECGFVDESRPPLRQGVGLRGRLVHDDVTGPLNVIP